jgi:tetratricopeptide (TPR) repeat protein
VPTRTANAIDIRSILLHLEGRSLRGGGLPTLSPDRPGRQPLSGQLVVFTGKLSSLGRRDARALVARLGGDTSDDVNVNTTMLVVGAEGFGQGIDDGDKSNKLKRAEELNAQRAALIEIVTEDDFCRKAGVPTPDVLKRQYHALRDLLGRYPALREDHVRYFVKCGLLQPVARTNADTFFAFPDLALIKQANDDLVQGASFRSVVRSLVAARQGQLALDFRLDASPAKVIALQPRPKAPDAPAVATRDAALAEEYFRYGSELDDGGETNLEGAAGAYRKALALDPSLVPALINLANIHYSRDEVSQAQALYERAIGLDPCVFEAHFNLGNIHHDRGLFAEALDCYREALRLNPSYADTHFYLAVTLERAGRSPEARPHWRAYQQLAPKGEWIALAREFSE